MPQRTSTHRALVIEVEGEGVVWTAMAHEEGGILDELKHAPPAKAISVYEWVLAEPINPTTALFSRMPSWQFIRRYPWSV